MQDITLVIMAAGMGSRFGGLKQIEPVGPNGEFIIDYSIYDAYQAGIRKVVIIIKEENYDIFRETVGKRIEKKMKVSYAFQRQTDIPQGVNAPSDRVKPWGTGQAVLAAKPYVDGNFVIINADDFYGKDAYIKAIQFFEMKKASLEYGIIGYSVKNTLTENGAVKRGVCQVEDNYLIKLTESSVSNQKGQIIAEPLDGENSFAITEDTVVSMNMFCFTKDIMEYLEKDFPNFFEKNKDNLEKCEYLIPNVVFDCVAKGLVKARVVPTTASWLGITYKEDLQILVNAIQKLIEEGVYPRELW